MLVGSAEAVKRVLSSPESSDIAENLLSCLLVITEELTRGFPLYHTVSEKFQNYFAKGSAYTALNLK